MTKRKALELIAADGGVNGCLNFTHILTCRDPHSGRTPTAPYLADRWCHACIAAEALESGLGGRVARALQWLRFVLGPGPIGGGR